METGEAPAPSFEQQFRNRDTLKFPEGKITVVDVAPEVLKDDVPVLIAPGWAENPKTYEETLAVGFREGRRVLTVEYSGHGGKVTSGGEYPKIELQKALLLLDVLDKKGIEKADVIAHSEGAINSLIAAMLKPDKFRNIVLDKPAGLIGQDSIKALAGRFKDLLSQEMKTRPKALTDSTSSIRAGGRTARYFVEHPLRVPKEVGALTSFDLGEIMKKLWEQGIKFSVIAGVDDPLFPVSRQTANMLKSKESNGVLPIEIKGYYSVIGGHNELSIHPGQHAALAFNALENLRDLKDTS